MNRISIYAAGVIAVLAAGGVALSVIADDADEATTATTATTTTTSVVSSPGDLADGVHVATIVAAYVAPDELVYEPADLLVGEEAAAAAEADGAEALDFYVRHHPDARATAPVAADVRVTTVDCSAACEEGAPSDYDTLTRDADGRDLFRLTVRDGVVVAIDAVYLP